MQFGVCCAGGLIPFGLFGGLEVCFGFVGLVECYWVFGLRRVLLVMILLVCLFGFDGCCYWGLVFCFFLVLVWGVAGGFDFVFVCLVVRACLGVCCLWVVVCGVWV